MKQLIPQKTPQSAQQFAEDKEKFCRLLARQGNDATWYTQAFNPYPLGIDSDQLALQKRLHLVLHQAINSLVAAYFKDQRLQAILKLPDRIHAVLKQMEGRPYRIGTYRPDFVHDKNGQIKICEINARFPTNAYFISHYINNIAPQLIADSLALQHLRSLEGVNRVVSTFLKRLSESGAPLAVVKGREKGWDISFLLYEMAKNKIDYHQLEPEDLDLAFMQLQNPFVYLELHQDEFEDRLSAQVLQRLSEADCHFNELRTIFLVHDKRFLALLTDDRIMQDYLNFDDAAFLRKHVIPTYVLGLSPNALDRALANKNEWVLKPNLLGKGLGIIFGKNVSADLWQQTLSDKGYADFVLQRYIDQYQYPVVNGTQSPQLMNIVGTLLCFDDIFFGPGIYRASAGDIVNVAGGGTILFPLLDVSTEVSHA